MCTHDFSRVTFATELPTNLVYNSIFVIDYNYICIHLLFFFTIKLSIFSRLCVTQKKSWSGQHTLRYKNSALPLLCLRVRCETGCKPACVNQALLKAPLFTWSVKSFSYEADALEQRRPCTRTSATTSNFYSHTLKKWSQSRALWTRKKCKKVTANTLQHWQ